MISTILTDQLFVLFCVTLKAAICDVGTGTTDTARRH